jgi:hypothetical protein
MGDFIAAAARGGEVNVNILPFLDCLNNWLFWKERFKKLSSSLRTGTVGMAHLLAIGRETEL